MDGPNSFSQRTFIRQGYRFRGRNLSMACSSGRIAGRGRLIIDIQDWARHQVAPWVLYHAGHPVGVAGFRIGFGEDGLELSFHFLPEVAGQGLASEFCRRALDHAC